MGDCLKLPKFSVGVGDRFAHQAKAQLAAAGMALIKAKPIDAATALAAAIRYLVI